jgi:hypothetical protein
MPTLVLALALLFLQTPKASLEGMVLNRASGQPIAGARVSVYRLVPPATPLHTVVTDGTGRFLFAGLDAGEYSVHADIKGYAIDWLYETFPGAIPGRRVTLKDSQRLQDFQFQLVPEAIVGGRVLGAMGEPVADVEVQLILSRYQLNGRTSYVTGAALRTDDRGEYRFFGLEPGRYYLRVAAPLTTSRGNFSQGISDFIGASYLPTFFPSASSIAEAMLLDVKAGSPMENADVILRKRASTRYRVQGRVTDARGPLPPDGVQYTFHPLRREGITGARFSRTAPDGTFEIPDLDPGTYVIQAQIQAPVARPQPGEPRPMFPTVYAFATVDVVSVDVTGVTLTFQTIPLAGKVRMDQGELPAGLQVRLAGTMINSPPPATVGPDGSVAFVNVSPGAEYDVVVSGLPPDMYLKEASFGTVDLRYERLRVTEGPQRPILIEIGTNGRSLDGAAAVEARIALVPNDRARRDLYRFATVGADGKYSLRAIVPGDYKLFVFGRDTEPYAVFDPAFLQTHEQNGTVVGVENTRR